MNVTNVAIVKDSLELTPEEKAKQRLLIICVAAGYAFVLVVFFGIGSQDKLKAAVMK